AAVGGRAPAPLPGGQARLQDGQVGGRGQLPTRPHGRVLGGPRLRMVRRRVTQPAWPTGIYPIVSDEELERAGEEGKSRGPGMSEGAATLTTWARRAQSWMQGWRQWRMPLLCSARGSRG